MAESRQHTLDRVRPPRVQITYDVETNGAMVRKELPFVVGIMGDLSGHNKDLPPLQDRKFVNIDRDNINDVMKSAAPELNIRVNNTLAEDNSSLALQLKFREMGDFQPAQVAEQVPALKQLLEMRKKLDEVLSKIATNPKLESLLQDVIANSEQVKQLATEMGIQAGSNPPAEEK